MYMKKRKKDHKKIIYIVIFVLCLITGFIVNVVTTERNLSVFEKAIKDSVITAENILSIPLNFVSNKIAENKEKNEMYEEYLNLKSKVNQLNEITSQNEELNKQLKELKTLLNLQNTLTEYINLNATVINRDLGYWYNTIDIDKGESDGITVDMPVVVNDGLIGKVIKTTNFTSTVRLLTSNNTNDRISVKIKNGEEYIYGILNGYDNIKNTYTIEGISQNIDIEIGSIVTTTGMGDIFPAGIIIGKITGVNTDNFDLANVLEMQSDVNFDDINYVTVLKRNVQ